MQKPTNQKVREACISILEKHGWNRLDSVGLAIAQKEYMTAVGKKVAHVYLYANQDGHTLKGEYWSEGHNVLEARSSNIQTASTMDDVLNLVSTFAENVDAVIDESYARRLFVRHGFVDRTVSIQQEA